MLGIIYLYIFGVWDVKRISFFFLGDMIFRSGLSDRNVMAYHMQGRQNKKVDFGGV